MSFLRYLSLLFICRHVDVDVDVEEIRAQTNNCLYARY